MTDEELPQIIKDYEEQCDLFYEIRSRIKSYETEITKTKKKLNKNLKMIKLATEGNKESAYLNRIFERLDEKLCELDRLLQIEINQLEIESNILNDLFEKVTDDGWKKSEDFFSYGKWVRIEEEKQ